jgi:hypothetical protein
MNECEYCDAESGGRSVDRALSGEVILTSESWQCGSWRNTSSDATCKPIHYRSDRCRIRQLTAERDALRERLSVAEEAINNEALHHAGALIDIPEYLESDPYHGEAYAKERRYHAARQAALEAYQLAIRGQRAEVAQ